LTFDSAYFPKNIERRITQVIPQINSGVPLWFSGEDEVVLGGTLNAAIDNQGIRNGVSTNGSTNNVAGIKGDKMYTRAMHVDFHVKFKLTQLTSERVFIGLTSVDSTGMVSGDSPTGNFVGLSFSTSRGDVNFMFIRNDAGVMPAAVSSGVLADTNLHDLYIWCQDAAVVIQLDNARVVFTTDLPNLSTLMRYDAELIALAAAVKKFELGKIRVSQDN
jgi:hypothetical protein